MRSCAQEKGVDFSKFDFVVTGDPFKNRLLDMFEVRQQPSWQKLAVPRLVGHSYSEVLVGHL